MKSKRLLKSIFAATLVAALGFGMVPYQPIAQVFDTGIVANAQEETVTTWDSREIPMSDVLVVNNGVYFDDLCYATIYAQDGDVIKLEKDFASDDVDLRTMKDRKITLDLNGHTITAPSGAWVFNNSMWDEDYNADEDTAQLTIINGTIEGELLPYYYSKLTLGEDLTVHNAGDAAVAANNAWKGTVLTISGATIISDDDIAVYWPARDSVINMTDGLVKGTTAMYVKCGTVNISGGTLEATGEKVDYQYNGSGANSTGDALILEACTRGYGQAPQANITGGNFISANASSVSTYTNANSPFTAPENFVEGGTFTSGGEPDTNVTNYFADNEENVVMPSDGTVESKTELKENGYALGELNANGTYTATPDGTFIDDEHHAWYQLENGVLTIYGDGEVADKELAFKSNLKIKTVHFTDNVKVKSLRGWFQGCKNLTTVTGQIPECERTNLMFSGCEALESIETFPTITGTSLGLANNMFQSCTSLTGIADGTIELTGTGSIASMFNGCKNLSVHVVINGDIVCVSTTGLALPFEGAATEDDAKITVCFGENATEKAVAEAHKAVKGAKGNVQFHNYEKASEDGVNTYTCTVCGDTYTTYDVVYNGAEIGEYRDDDEVTFTYTGDADKVAWFVNGGMVKTDGNVSYEGVVPGDCYNEKTLTWTVSEPISVESYDAYDITFNGETTTRPANDHLLTFYVPNNKPGAWFVNGKMVTDKVYEPDTYTYDDKGNKIVKDEYKNKYFTLIQSQVRGFSGPALAFAVFEDAEIEWRLPYYVLGEEKFEGDKVVVNAPEGAESGAWFVNGKRIDNLENAKNYVVGADNSLTITVCENVETAEWREFKGEALTLKARTNDDKKFTMTATWSVPTGATVTRAGVARIYADKIPEGTEDVAQYIFENGTKSVARNKSVNGKYSVTVSMTAAAAQHTICAVTFVEYTLDGETYLDFSEVAESAPAATLLS